LQIEAGLLEALAHRKGTLALKSRHVEAMPAARVREIRRALAKSTKEFERRFGIPARTLEGWEQGRKIDVAHRVLLTVIAKSPDVVEAALTEVALK
jgi:putative transcriptional regulator